MLVADLTLGLYKRIGPVRRRFGWLDVTDLRPGLEVGYVSGACFAGRVAALERIGGFDERFFLYYEEADWCRRALAAGWRLAVAAGVRATHEMYASSASEARARAFYYRSRYLFVRKHYTAAGVLLVRAADAASGFLMWVIASTALGVVATRSLERARTEGLVRYRCAIGRGAEERE
jgi:GT2 family glycosyltransferase